MVVAASLLSLVATPLAAFGVAHLLGLKGAAFQAGVLQASMPTAVVTTILALEFDVSPNFVTSVVCVTTLLSPLTLTLLIAYLQGVPEPCRGIVRARRTRRSRSRRSPPRTGTGAAVPEGAHQVPRRRAEHELQRAHQRGRRPGHRAVGTHRQRRGVRPHESVADDEAEERHQDAGESAEAGVGVHEQRRARGHGDRQHARGRSPLACTRPAR